MTKTIFIIAGEESGDLLGGSLMRDLRTMEPDIKFNGIGGTAMQEQGMCSMFPMEELSIMGVFEVIKHLPIILKRMRQTVDAIKKQNPDILITIDSPDFCLRVAKKIKNLMPHIKIIHYVAPTVWAWRPKRAKKIAQFLDGLMCLLPFEPSYFTKHGLKSAFVGHPLVNKIKPLSEVQQANFYCTYALNDRSPLVCLLPGSRRREVHSLWPEFLSVATKLHHEKPEIQFILPTLPHLLPLLGEVPKFITLITDIADKYTAFQCSDIALHASGTVALELALSETPMVMAYKIHPFSAFLARFLVTTKHFSLVNILRGRQVTPELLQQDAQAENIYVHLSSLLDYPEKREQQLIELKEIRSVLTEPMPRAAANFVRDGFLTAYQPE
jgi:lipid-A-disaccharide synthase